MTSTVIGWNTTKTADGFQFRVYTVGYQVPTETLKTGICSSRAKAKLQAQKWARYLKAQRAQEIA